MRRVDLQKLALIRVKEGKVLFNKKCYSGAYYVSGYAVECALKACIAKRTKKSDFPPDRKALENIYTHEIERLIKGAGLELDRDSMLKSDKIFERYWTVVKDWSEEARYNQYKKIEAEDLITAINDPRHGVLLWIQNYW
jgi:hypothetical protein